MPQIGRKYGVEPEMKGCLLELTTGLESFLGPSGLGRQQVKGKDKYVVHLRKHAQAAE